MKNQLKSLGHCLLSVALVAGLCMVTPDLMGQTSVEDVEKKIYKAIGGPTAPQVKVFWNRYHDVEECTEILQSLATTFPELARLESIGKSTEGRDMWVITITNFSEGDATTKPGFWIDGGIHANEIQATEVALYTAWFLLEMHAENSFVQDLLRDRVFYILPDLSPDSRHAHFYRPNSTNSPRSGQRPVDDDMDGLVNEDGYNDLNGDGHITQMRIRDPNGRYKSHPKYPDLMVPVEEGEKGEFTILGFESYDEDGDGRAGEDGDGSYDPNRDWPWNWQPNYVQRGAFRYPFSLIENRVMADFVKQRPNIAGAQTYHNTGGMLLRGPGSKEDSYEREDLAVYDQIGKTGERILPGYRYLNVANDLYEVWGGEIDWFHQMLGVFTFTNELFTQYNYFHLDRQRSEQAPAGGWSREFDRLVLFGDGIVPWEEVDHPVYGKIEVGGTKKNWGRQPPGFMLQEECHRNMAFTLYHADQMPRVRIEEVHVKSFAADLHEVTALIRNNRITPTHSTVDLRNKITRPDHIIIEGEGTKVVLGKHAADFLFRNSTVQANSPEIIKLPSIGGNSLIYVRWIVRGNGQINIKVDSVKGGVDQRTADLTQQ
ncbi:MAG TPA: M14 family metallopeptidase [Pirellulaceae bacterium]|nr:M14 family metallopeptidase [Pirellulaceae bacterium]HMO90989.1 M14 family metallopeptidase [Pirellulaceae bacterium]HMP68104.1 M14 family metallopeptidase [Pirellulaceae bacterium]